MGCKKVKLGIGIVTLCLGSMMFAGCEKAQVPVEEVIVPETKIEIEGVVAVEDKMEFNIEFPATITNVHVKDGEKVKVGDILATLDLEDYKNQIAQKENEIKLYEIELQELGEVLYPQNAYITQISNNIKEKQAQLEQGTDQDVKKLENNLEIAKQNYDKGLKDYNTLEELLEVQAVSQEEVTKAKLALQEASKQIENLELSIEQTKQSKKLEIESLKAELGNLTTQVNNGKKQSATGTDKLRIQMETATLQLESMKSKLDREYLQENQIIAPSEGLIIYNINCQKGSKVETIIGPLMEGLDEKSLVIEANLPEEYNGDLQLGDTVEVLPYTDQGAILKGKVIRKAEHATESYGETVIKTIIKVEDTKGLLTIGGNVDIQF